VDSADALDGDVTTGNEQVQERRLGHLDALAGLQAGSVERGIAVLDANGGGAVVLFHPGCNGYQAAG
jgi:hypothetical protein